MVTGKIFKPLHEQPMRPELLPLDSEIERTFLARRREQQQGLTVVENMVEGEVGDMVNIGQPVQVNNPVPQLAFVDDRDRAIREYAVPMLHGLNPRIVRPEIHAPQFELKLVMLQTVRQFSGMATKDPYLHLRLFMEVNDSFKLQGVT